MNCPTCGGPVEVRHNATYRYTESGLDDVELVGVEVRRCAKCGDAAVIPDLEGLHRVIAKDLAVMRRPLRKQEIAFLAKYLAYSDNPTLAKIGAQAQNLAGKSVTRAVSEMAVRTGTLLLVSADPKQVERFMRRFDRAASAAHKKLSEAEKTIRVRRNNQKKEWRPEPVKKAA